ncbi:hypothetical protein LTR85_008746 [Meristemomyces frigidus]|nr:hypothetical protein LTR85_008746 [Meristemomyces frigidus]
MMVLTLSEYISCVIGNAKVAGVRVIPVRRTETGWEPITQESKYEEEEEEDDDDDDRSSSEASDESQTIDADASPEPWAMAAEDSYERQIAENTTQEQIERLADTIVKQMSKNAVLLAEKQKLQYQHDGLVAQLWEAQEAHRLSAEDAAADINGLTKASARITAENEELTARVHVMHGTIRDLASRIQPLQQEISQLQLDVTRKDATIMRMGSQLDAQATDLEAAVKKNREWLADHEEEVAKAYRLVDQREAVIAGLEAKLRHWKGIQGRTEATSARRIETLQDKLAEEKRIRDQQAVDFPKWFEAQQQQWKEEHSKALATNEWRWSAKWAADLDQLSQKRDEEIEAKDQQILALADQQRHVQKAWHGAHRAELKNAWDNAQFCHQKQKEAEEKLKVLQAASEGWHAVEDAEAEAAVKEEAAAKPKHCLGAEECKDEGCFCRNVVQDAETVREEAALEAVLLANDEVDDMSDFDGCDIVSLNDFSDSDVEINVDRDSESESESDDDDNGNSSSKREKESLVGRRVTVEDFAREAELVLRMMRGEEEIAESSR